jgi:regulator of sigma D
MGVRTDRENEGFMAALTEIRKFAQHLISKGATSYDVHEALLAHYCERERDDGAIFEEMEADFSDAVNFADETFGDHDNYEQYDRDLGVIDEDTVSPANLSPEEGHA